MSLRKITDQQFSQGTTIDGDRIEDALQSLEDYINEVEDGSIKTRWIPQTIHLGYLPNTTVADTFMKHANATSQTPMTPWLPVANKGALDTTPDVTNQFRLKGTRLPYFPPIPNYSEYTDTGHLATDTSNQVVWSTSYAFSTPVILDAISVIFATDDTSFASTFHYSGTAPDGRTNSDWVSDIQILVTLDSPFTPETQSSHGKIYHKGEFSSEAWMMSSAYSAPTADMVPGIKAGITYKNHETFAFNETDLKIPLPIDTRIRFSVVLPFWDTTHATAGTIAAPWLNKPQKFIPSLALTILEPLLNG